MNDRGNVNINVEIGDVSNLKFEDNFFDYVVATLVFCSVTDVGSGLREIERVLKKNGTFIFIEHILPEKKFLRTTFNGLTPIWRKFANNCHLNREFEIAIKSERFNITDKKIFLNGIFLSGMAKKIDL